MTRLTFALGALALGACQPAGPAATAARSAPEAPAAALAAIDSTQLRAHIATLASDAFEGRGTGTEGERKAVAYVIEQFRALGLEGGMPDGSFTQDVPLRSTRVAQTTPLTFRPDVGTPTSFEPVSGMALTTDTDAASASLDGADLVFVGYGITNPAERWDDYAGVDVTGKVVVSFVNDPPATAEEPTLFQADTMTYNGRWTYKFEEARRRGARGMLLIHTEETAGYPFGVIADDALGAHPTGATPPRGALEVRGWISEDAGDALARMSGASLGEWLERAGTRGFRAVELPVVADVSMELEQTSGLIGHNVVAKLPGRTPEAVVYGAHHDHLGMDEDKVAAGEDGIYNGAIDNASGVAMMIEIARAFAAAPGPLERTVYFVTFTAEEAGLLGSDHFAANPPVPLGQMVANVNVDSGNLYGETDDIVGIGSERSDLAGLLAAAADAEGLTVTPDNAPSAGLFYRSDQLAFARGGVPAVFLGTGDAYRGRPAGYGASVRDAYRADRYHQPSDELTDELTMAGILQQTRVAFRLGYALAASDLAPAWRPGEAFDDARRASRGDA